MMVRSVLSITAALGTLMCAAGAHAKPARWETLPLPPAMPIADRVGEIAIDGASIKYGIFDRGMTTPPTAPKPIVILLHGGLGNYDHFAFQLPALLDKFQVIGIDTRGQGRSSRGKSKLSYHVMAGDVVAVMDALAIKKASIVGWSDGGEMALDLAITVPDRIERIFVLGSNYDDKGSKPRNGARSPTFEAYAVKCKRDYEKLSKTPRAWDIVVDSMLPVWRNPAGFTRDQLKTIKAPTMMADGDHDEVIVLDQVKEMAQLIPNGRFTVFTGTSHFAMWQAPDDVNHAIVEFLTAAQ